MVLRTALLGALMMPSAAYAQNSVLWYFGNGGQTTNSSEFEDHHTNQLSGSVVFENDWAQVDLTQHRYILLAKPETPFTPQQVSDLSTYTADGGLVVIVGDTTAFGNAHTSTINTLLTELFPAPANPMQLVDGNELNECLNANADGSSGFFPVSGVSMSSTGVQDIAGNDGDILLVATVTPEPPAMPYDVRLAALQDSVLLLTDYGMVDNSICGLALKQSLWTNLFNSACDKDGDGTDSLQCGGFDCDDLDPAVGGDARFADLDGDGYGDPSNPRPCDASHPTDSSDCDDSSADISPDAIEVCDGVDNDCDANVDVGAEGAPTWYADVDGDGYGDPESTAVSCEAPSGYIEDDTDCDDASDLRHPNASEFCNGQDEDCDNVIDDGDVCEPDPNDPNPNTPDPDEKKGCSSVSAAPALGWLLLLPVLARRRGRR